MDGVLRSAFECFSCGDKCEFMIRKLSFNRAELDILDVLVELQNRLAATKNVNSLRTLKDLAVSYANELGKPHPEIVADSIIRMNGFEIRLCHAPEKERESYLIAANPIALRPHRAFVVEGGGRRFATIQRVCNLEGPSLDDAYRVVVYGRNPVRHVLEPIGVIGEAFIPERFCAGMWLLLPHSASLQYPALERWCCLLYLGAAAPLLAACGPTTAVVQISCAIFVGSVGILGYCQPFIINMRPLHFTCQVVAALLTVFTILSIRSHGRSISVDLSICCQLAGFFAVAIDLGCFSLLFILRRLGRLSWEICAIGNGKIF